MRDSPASVLLDATALSNFAASESVDFLDTTFERPAVVEAVVEEISRGLAGGHRFLEPAALALDSGEIEVVDEPTYSCMTSHEAVHHRLGRGRPTLSSPP